VNGSYPFHYSIKTNPSLWAGSLHPSATTRPAAAI
jgi:hypothetical protein